MATIGSVFNKQLQTPPLSEHEQHKEDLDNTVNRTTQEPIKEVKNNYAKAAATFKKFDLINLSKSDEEIFITKLSENEEESIDLNFPKETLNLDRARGNMIIIAEHEEAEEKFFEDSFTQGRIERKNEHCKLGAACFTICCIAVPALIFYGIYILKPSLLKEIF